MLVLLFGKVESSTLFKAPCTKVHLGEGSGPTRSEKAKAFGVLTAQPQLNGNFKDVFSLKGLKGLKPFLLASQFAAILLQWHAMANREQWEQWDPDPKSFPTTLAKSFWKRESSYRIRRSLEQHLE